LNGLSTTLFLDIETNGNQLLDVGVVMDTGELHERSSARLEAWIRKATHICGHNLIAHDAPFLRKKLKSDVFAGKALVDTLFWSALLFPEKPYHNLVKGYKLNNEDADNNPLSDAKLCKRLLDELIGVFNGLDGSMRAVYHGLLHDKEGYAGFFAWAGFEPSERAGSIERIRDFFKDRICIAADLGSISKKHPVELAHALALIATTDEASILPAWVVRSLPRTEDILHVLRFAPCDQSGCGHCTRRLDPQRGLKGIFGYDSFRRFDGEMGMGIQERAVRHALKGGSLLTVFPTGGGKSLTFQLPALMQGELTRALTVVISPLVSLMKDQVEVLEDRFQNVQAVHLSGLLSPLERKQVLEQVEQGGAHLLYIAPETLRSPTLARLLRVRHIARFVVDEAHCFSSWGHDFRVDYLYIAPYIRQLQEDKGLNRPIPISCFTATAKPQVIEDIYNYFKEGLGIELQAFVSHARRENLEYEVVSLPDSDPKTRIRKLLQLVHDCEKPAIVYASRTKRVEELVTHIGAVGINVRGYHGQMKREVKQANQDAFMKGEADVMVATSAFGMGVDKEDVRTVIHYNISASLESYVQEAGRAGRKKEIQAKCYILYNENDLSGHFQLLQRSKLNQKEIDQVWRAIKGMTRFRDRVSKSAKELARAAGWEQEIKDVQNKVTASLAALEDRGYVKRTLNSPQVFATSLLTKDLEGALRLVNASAVITEKQKEDCWRVLQRIIKDDETQVDQLADQLGMSLRQAVDTIQHLRSIKVLNDHEDLSAFLDLRPRSGSRTRLERIMATEKSLLQLMEEGTMHVSLRALNQGVIDQGVDGKPGETQGLLNYWKRRGFIRTLREDKQENMYRLQLRTDVSEMKREIEQRHALVVACLDHLLTRAKDSGSTDEREKEEVLVQFSMIALQEGLASAMFGIQADLKAIEKSLLYLNETKVITLEDGFMVVYQRLNVERVQTDNRKRYTVEDYGHLRHHYQNRVEQIHVVGEYARKRSESVQAALGYVDDYFKLDHDAFIQKYFPRRRTEITRPITAQRFTQLVGDLDTAQTAIVSDTADHILVAAGPGSGKTRVLVHKVANLLLLEDVKPEQFLMLTFSKGAALEFRRRIHAMVPEYRGLIKVTTFHGLCFELMGQLGDLDKSETVIGRTVEAIRNNTVDTSAIANKSVIMLDEFQDVDAEQWRFIQTIAEKAEGPRIIAVGDDDQNIYEWRGASPEFMAAFRERFKAKTHSLLTNYRSKASLVDLTNHLAQSIRNRIKVDELLIAKDTEVGSQRVVGYTAGFHLQGLVEDLTAQSYPGTTAVLTRTNDEALLATTLLRRMGIRARYIGGSEDFKAGQLREIKLFHAMLRQEHPHVGVVPADVWRKVRTAYLEKLSDDPLRQDCEDLLDLFEREHHNRLDSAEWIDFMREISFSDAVTAEQGTVFVSTMHKSKGKEFSNVFVLMDGHPLETDEQRRLLYVACTRAMERLVVHTNTPFLPTYTAPSVQRIHSSAVYPMPPEIHCVLGMRDIYLGAAPYNEHRIRDLQTGDALRPDSTHFSNNDAPGLGAPSGNVAIFSSAFMRKTLPRLEQQGYHITGGSVEYIVEWYSEEKKRTYEVVLPRVKLER